MVAKLFGTVLDASGLELDWYNFNDIMEQMEYHVLDHEPSLALFVPDDDPLLFYRAIAKYSVTSLTPGGQLYLEINPHYAADLVELLLDSGLAGIEVHNDQYGKQRMIKAVKP